MLMSNCELVEGGLLEEWLLMYFKFKEENLKTCMTSTSLGLGNSVEGCKVIVVAKEKGKPLNSGITWL